MLNVVKLYRFAGKSVDGPLDVTWFPRWPQMAAFLLIMYQGAQPQRVETFFSLHSCRICYKSFFVFVIDASGK
jgi:hypothetical protein